MALMALMARCCARRENIGVHLCDILTKDTPKKQTQARKTYTLAEDLFLSLFYAGIQVDSTSIIRQLVIRTPRPSVEPGKRKRLLRPSSLPCLPVAVLPRARHHAAGPSVPLSAILLRADDSNMPASLPLEMCARALGKLGTDGTSSDVCIGAGRVAAMLATGGCMEIVPVAVSVGTRYVDCFDRAHFVWGILKCQRSSPQWKQGANVDYEESIDAGDISQAWLTALASSARCGGGEEERMECCKLVARILLGERGWSAASWSPGSY